METNRFNHITIQQYLDGKLDEKAMHELEKQALDDPFLADALEGYTHTEIPAGKHLSILQTQLQERIAQHQENKNVFNFTWQRLSVAAAACLLFVTATMLFWLREDQAEKRIASRPKRVDVNLTPLDSTKKQALEQDAAIADHVTTVENKTITATTRKGKRSEVLVAANRANKEQINESSTSTLAAAAEPQPQTDLATDHAVSAFTIKGKDLQDVPVANSEQLMQGRIARVSTDSGKGSNTSAPSKTSDQIQIRGVQSGFTAGQSVKEPVPLDGWEAYNLYLKNNIRWIGKEIKNGFVLVSFSVNNYGVPENLKVVSRLSEANDLEALRLIKQGPLWKRGQDSVVVLPVRFEK